MRVRFIDRALKSLIRQFGKTVTFKNEASRSQSLQTGVISRSYESVSARALVAPATANRDFVYDISYLAANKNFVYGGQFDKELIELTVRRDALSGFVIDLRTIVVIGSTAYMVSKCEIDSSPGDYYYRLNIKRTDFPALAQVVISRITSSMRLRTVNPTVVIA